MTEHLEVLVRFPVPEYGLACPVCKHSLDGVPSEVCPECEVEFDLAGLLSAALDGHSQQARRGALRVLVAEASPDCPVADDLVNFFAASDQYALSEAVAAAVRVARQRQEAVSAGRDDQTADSGADPEERALAAPPGQPLFTGYELPIPNMGWHCAKCHYPLRGLPRHICPECGTAFDPGALLGGEPAVSLCTVSTEVEHAMVKSVLEARQIPHAFESSDVMADTLRLRFASRRRLGRVTVPREFYFDAVFWLRRATEAGQPAAADQAAEPGRTCGRCAPGEAEAETEPDWTCPQCGESVPGGFEMCWNCCTTRPGE